MHSSIFGMIIFTFTLWSSQKLVLSSSHNDFPIAKPNCNDSCGGISIPFPFGTTPQCYISPEFRLTCNHTSSDPPKLFTGETNFEITDISLDGQITLLNSIAYECFNSNGIRSSNFSEEMRLGSYLTVNHTANKFTMVGCSAIAVVSGATIANQVVATAGVTQCSSEVDVTEGTCNGVGCFQVEIPQNVSDYIVTIQRLPNYTNTWNFSNCTYAFVVDDSAFKFSKDNLTNLSRVKSLPVVADWVVRNETCHKTISNTATYACVSVNSTCYNPTSGYGYRCRCKDGFLGNPYLFQGCIDIDECSNQTLHDCNKKASCTNTIGNYTCTCPENYEGDGRGEDGCKEKPPKDMKITYVLIGVIIGVICLLLGIILLYLDLKRRSHNKMKRKFFLQNGGHLLQEKLATREASPDMVTIFTSSELEKATNSFHNSMIIGRGGFGTVYKGVLADARTVAIKRSIRVDPTQIEQFINEVVVLSQINHRNVVRLLGCCLEKDVPLLVYEFISNGTLSSHLHNEAKAHALDWNTRLKIAAETAGVLSYLHSSASTPIIHRDVKSDNILLDHTLTVKVSDFGASKLVPIDLDQLTTVVLGTLGYLDPEYMLTNQLTEKSDVYSFGVVLLELVTGRKALSFNRPVEEKSLSNYFLYVLKQDLLVKIIDEKIVGLGNMEQISTVCKLAKECLNVKGEDRPSMKEVAMELEGLILREKHSWATNVDDVEEMKSLIPNDHDGTSGVGYDSISMDHIVLPINDGGR
ncbi:putative wall-associated receptor kinase-like 16 [Salvia splendens]|uniref:putative wall-associated receptor kinase-like 16 n=1 Tax=Salvia splendens TaxID=180675 RepID=UPI0011028C66|nr:putative wall-associated receptor kinase-like 16 [Salvia splendens]